MQSGIMDNGKPSSSGDVLLSLKCSDAGIADCEWIGRSRNEAILLLLFNDHVRTRHGMSVDDDLKKKVLAGIKSDTAKFAD